MTEQVSRTNVAGVWLVLEGKTYPISSVSMNWYLNRIPTAAATLAVGTNVHTGEIAAIHQADKSMLRMLQAEIWADLQGYWSAGGSQWPGEVCLFKGYLSGWGLSQVRGSLRLVAHLEHWLGDLDFTTSLSSTSEPMSMTQFSWQGIFPVENATAGAPVTVAAGYIGSGLWFKPANIQKDLWGLGLQPMLKHLIDRDPFKFTPADQCLKTKRVKNPQPLASFNRIEGPNGAPPSKWYCESGIPLGPSGTTVALSICREINGELMQAYSTTTIWGKLVEGLCPAFLLSIVPRIDTAMIVPYSPTLRTPYEKILRAADTSFINADAPLVRPIRGVVMYGGRGTMTNVSDPGDQNGRFHPRVGVGGCYSPPNPDLAGLLMLRQPPDWLRGIQSHAYSVRRSSLGGSRKATKCAITAHKAGCPGNAEGQTPSDVIMNSSNLYARMAHAIYAAEVLRGRSCLLQGKLRFDITPGSVVAVETTPELRMGGQDRFGTVNLVGSVVRMTCSLDTESPSAATAIQLSCVRTEEENELEEVSVDSHPLYPTGAFNGAPLTDSLLFAGE